MPLATFSMEGVALVILGNFSPLQMNPQALASQNFLDPEDMSNLTEVMATEDFIHFKLPWASFSCDNNRLEINTSDQPQIRILDLVLNILQANTTIQCKSFGINWLVHTNVMDSNRKKELEKFAVSPWNFNKKGSAKAQFRSLEWIVKDKSLFENRPCHVKLQPSVIQSGGVFIAINDHMEIPKEESLNTNFLFAKLQDRWDASKREAYEVFDSVWDSL